MNVRRKISSSDARLSLVSRDGGPARTAQPDNAEFRRPPEQEAAIERWRGEIPEDASPATSPASAETKPSAEAKPAEAKASPAQNTASPAKKKKRFGGRTRALLIGGVVLALGAGAWFGHYYWTVGRFLVSTDDAYVRADNTTLAAKIPGYISTIVVDDNSQVHAGDVIATIDDGDYKLAVDSARDKVATQQATVERIGRQVVAQEANVAQAKAQLASAQAGKTRAQLEFERQQALASKDFASRQTLEQAQTNRDQAVAAVQSAEAAIESAEANVAVLKAQRQEAMRTLDELKTALAKAERDLAFTTIRAPVDGVIGNRAMQIGDYVQTGQRLASLVPLQDVYVDANFKETQLARIRPGQPVSVKVDALDGEAVEGVVESISPASGSVFSLLPPDNATGNFTKIVQRLPVRIRVHPGVASQNKLRPGMSVIASVDTKPGAVASIPLIGRFATLPRAAETARKGE